MANRNENSFYDEILGAGMSMEKQASAKDLAEALEQTDLTDEELNKIASELEDALANDIDDIEDESDEDFGDDNIDEDGEDAGVGEEGEDDDEAYEDISDEDIENLAAAYEAEYEKYASEGLGARDYVFNQVDDEEFAITVGDMAEKLAFVSDLPVFMVADDLLNTIASKISDEEECGR